MPSPPLLPDHDPIDVAHLRRMTLGDASLERDVLDRFVTQARRLIVALAALPADSAALAHTLKGSARAIGAIRVAACADAAEDALVRGEDPSQAIAALDAAVTQANASIHEILRQG
jgi:HPt (histidine-containing phosphotransfer) domain-containing protein